MFQPWTRVLSTCSNYQWWSTATHHISTQQMDMNVLKSKATLPEMTYPTRRCLSTRLLYTGPYIIVFCSDTHTLLAKSVWQICHRGMPCKRESCDNWKALMPQELVLVCLGPPLRCIVLYMLVFVCCYVLILYCSRSLVQMLVTFQPSPTSKSMVDSKAVPRCLQQAQDQYICDEWNHKAMQTIFLSPTYGLPDPENIATAGRSTSYRMNCTEKKEHQFSQLNIMANLIVTILHL